MAKATPSPPPPWEILVAFLQGLRGTLFEGDNIVPVLRGSFLLKHWFGSRARPAADIDVECFEKTRGTTYDRFGSFAIYAKTMCMYAAADAGHHRGESQENPSIMFDEVDVPADGTSLWDYGTPGERCCTGWEWHTRGTSGLLQIDIAHAGTYDFADLVVDEIDLVGAGKAFRFLAYTPEMLLAAKLSWLLRGLKRHDSGCLAFGGEPKDLFDCHLILTEAILRGDLFEKSLYAVAAEDKLDWNNLGVFHEVRCEPLTDADFPNWPEFRLAHPDLPAPGPAEMLQVVAERIEPLLANLRAHAPFLLAIDADPVDEVPYLVYADWLQERSDPRGDFLRLCTEWLFHDDSLPRGELIRTRDYLARSLPTISSPWLYHVFGGAERFRQFKQRIAIAQP